MNQKARPPDPPWKNPTRPCPFYSQGKCLFSDSCAFLHEVKIKAPDSSIRVPSSVPSGNADGGSSGPGDPMYGPATSPDRSSRMTNLLLALKDVINVGDLEAETTDGGILQAIEIPSRFGDSQDTLSTDSDDATVHIPHTRSSPELTYRLPIPTGLPEDPLTPLTQQGRHSDTTTGAAQGSLDSIHPRSPNPDQRGSYPLSSQTSEKPTRDDSIDSGYAEFRASTPPPLTLSTPLSERRVSTLNLLSSPFGSPTTRAFPPAGSHFSALISPRFGSFPSFVSERAPSPIDRVAGTGSTRRYSDAPKPRPPPDVVSFASPKKDQDSTQDDPFSVRSPSLSSLDSPGAYPALPQDSPIHGDDGETESPVMSKGTPNRKRASSVATVMPQSEAAGPPPPLPESLPWVAEAEDDTVTSMYGFYQSSSSDHVWSPPSPVQNYSRPNSSASFYPPRPSSAAADLLSPKSFSNGNDSPLIPSRSSSALSIRTDLGPPSSTVPIGFRDPRRHGSRRISTAFRRPQPPALSPPHSVADLQRPSSSGSRPLRPLRLSMILNAGQSLASSMDEISLSASPSPSAQSDFSLSNCRLLSSARSSIIPGHVHNPSGSRDLSPLLLGTSGGSHQHHLSNFGSLSNITIPSPTPSHISTSSSTIHRQHNPLIPNREFRNSVHMHSRGPSTLSEPFFAVREEEEDVWNDGDASNLNVDLEETIRYPISTPHSPHLENLGEGNAQPPPAFIESPSSTAAPILDQMIDAHAANPSRSSTMFSGASASARLPVRDLHNTTSHPHAQSARSTPHFHSAPVFTKNPDSSTITNSRRPTQTHTRGQPSHAIATPRPTLMFAIASDDVSQVQKVLDSGEANPNDQVGPQSALKFALTNNQLTNRLEIVKTLLAFGADPTGLGDPSSCGQSRRSSAAISGSSPAHVGNSLNGPEIGGRKEGDPTFEAMKSQMDPATRYFINRADAPKTRRTSALIHRSFFRPLARMRYDVIGQDCAFEQLFRCLSIQSQNLSVSPLVVMLCGPSGHGKSLFARKFGSLLNVPTHTVNMTTLRSTHDLWQSHSMSPYEEPSTLTLAEFLTDNEGKQCVVVLDEIDKVIDEKTLFSLLMPWELGKCSFIAGQPHINARNVVWIATANTGHQLVFDHQLQRADPEAPMDRKEYMELINLLRPDVTKCLGASLISRVTTVLPFVPFTAEEKLALASQALFLQGGEHARSLSPESVDTLVADAVSAYIPSEGGRSLYRAVSNSLLDAIDPV